MPGGGGDVARGRELNQQPWPLNAVVDRAAVAVPDYESEPVLLVRLAEAHWRLRHRARAIETWLALCRLVPEEFEQLIDASDFPDWSLQNAWRIAQEQALEHEMTPAWFPVWMLIEEPGLADVLAPRHTDDEPSRAFDLVIALLIHPDLDERGIELRRSLQAIHPGLAGAISGEAGAGHRAFAAIGVEKRVDAVPAADAATNHAATRSTLFSFVA